MSPFMTPPPQGFDGIAVNTENIALDGNLDQEAWAAHPRQRPEARLGRASRYPCRRRMSLLKPVS